MNITDLWLQLQELEQQVCDAKSEASRSQSLLQAELNLIKAKLHDSYSAQDRRLEALGKRVKMLRGTVGTMVSEQRYRAIHASPELPTESPSEETLGGGQV